jgi:hypothetical protein
MTEFKPKLNDNTETLSAEDKAKIREEVLRVEAAAQEAELKTPVVSKVGLTSKVATASDPVVDKRPVVNEAHMIDFNEFMQPATADKIKELNAKIDWSKVKDDDIFNDAIVAIDLKLPSYLDMKPRDPSIMFRWVNRKFNGEGGNRYEQMRSMGFINARPEDCATVFDKNRINVQDGGILCGDLILMKIPKLLLLGMYKATYNKSNKMFDNKAVHEKAKSVANARV